MHGKVWRQRMSDRDESRDPIATMRAQFGLWYERASRFREDRALAAELSIEAAPVLEALSVALAPREEPRSLHEAYALLALLGRRAALLGATPGASVALVEAVCAAVREAGVTIDPERAAELTTVMVEGYCDGRDERITRELRQAAAASQVAHVLGPGCLGVFLGGLHAEPDLTPTLEQIARDLLRRDAKSCFLDVSRLSAIDEELARALARFCVQAASLGVATFVTGAPAWLQQQLAGWGVGAGATSFVDGAERAQALALAAAGLAVRPQRRWARLWLAVPGRLSG